MAINRKSRKALQISFLWTSAKKLKIKSKGIANKDLKIGDRRKLIRNLENKLTKSSRHDLTYEQSKKLESLIIALQNPSVILLNKEIIRNSVKYDFISLIEEIDSVLKKAELKVSESQTKRSNKHLNRILKKIKPYPSLVDLQRFRDKYYTLSDFSKRRVRITVDERGNVTFPEIDRLVDSLLKK